MLAMRMDDCVCRPVMNTTFDPRAILRADTRRKSSNSRQFSFISLSIMQKILFYCQSSLGIGHTIRSLRIAEGLSQSFEIHYLNGGELIPDLQVPLGIRRIDLPPIVSDPDFNTVRAVDHGMGVKSAIAKRRNIILQAFERISPEIVLIELYPFGRGRFHAELEPLLELAKNRGSKIICSVRDILTKRKNQDAFERKAVKRMNQFFDLLLIHGDPEFQPLNDSFARLDEIQARMLYTGYVVPEIMAEPRRKDRVIIASIGGGRFGHELAEAVVRAAPLLATRIPHRIQLYTGPFCPEEVVCHLRQLAHGFANIQVKRFTPDLHDKLMNADLSISMGGYNTMMNVVATGVPAMIMGCTIDGGMDQVARVTKLARLGVIDAIVPDDLEPNAFAEKIIACLNRKPARASLNINGVAATTQAIKRLVRSSGTNNDHQRGNHPCTL